MSFSINPKNISEPKIREDLDTLIQSAPDSDNWQIFFDSATGQIVKELLAGVSSFFTYKTVTARRETYHQYAQNRGSLIASSESLGYSTYKGRNTRLVLNVTPDTTTVYQKYDIIGSIKDQDLIVLEDTPVTAGQTVAVNVVVGLKVTENLSVGTDKASVFRFTSADVSEDFRVLLNGVELDVSDKIIDMSNGKYVALTNVFGAVDVMSLNDASYANPYILNDTLTLEFAKSTDISFAARDVVYDFGVLVSYTTASVALAAESKNEMRVNAPLYHETQARIRGRLDYLKVFRTLDTSIVDTNQRDVSSAVIELVYVKNDQTILTDIEKQSYVNALASVRTMGMDPPMMTDPVQIPLKLKISVTLNNNNGDVVNTIEGIIQTFENKLPRSLEFFDFDDLENQIEKAETFTDSGDRFIKTARIEISSDMWELVTGYHRGSHVNPTTENGLIYEMARYIYRTDSLEPSWPTVAGETIVDGDIIWTCRTVDLCVNLFTWQDQVEKFIRDYVVPTFPNGFMYEATGYATRSFGNDEVQRVTFSTVPDSGTWRIHFGSEQTVDLPFNATSLDVQAALRGLNSLSDVLVTGDYTAGFVINFTGADGDKEQVEIAFTDAGKNEIQRISFSNTPDAGQWGLEFDSQSTAPINFNANAAGVKAALEALPNVDEVEVLGDTANDFTVEFLGVNAKTDVPLLIQNVFSDTGVDEVQKIQFSSIPDAGTWRIHYKGEWTANMPFDANSVTVQSELNALSNLSGVVVTGDHTTEFVINFLGDDGKQNIDLLDVAFIGRNEIQKINFPTVPDNGTYRLYYNGEKTIDLAHNATTALIEAALVALPSIDAVSVTGDYSNGMTIEFINTSGLQDLLTLDVDDIGLDEVQFVNFSLVPDSGSFRLSFDSEETANIPFNATATDVKASLEALPNISEVDVSGDFSTNFVITFINDSGKRNVNQLVVSNNALFQGATAVTVGAGTTTHGEYPASNLFRLGVSIEITIEVTQGGLIPANSLLVSGSPLTLTAVETTQGVEPTTSLSNLGNSIDVTITEELKGEVPASNLTSGGSPVTITPDTLVDATAVEPTWPTEIGEKVIDGDIVWVAVPFNGTPNTWQPFTIYRQSDYVAPSTVVVDSSNVQLMFQVFQFVGTSGVVEPTWPTSIGNTVIDGNIVWVAKSPTTSPNPRNFNEYYEITQEVSVS